MATALLTTLYGAVMANLFCIPLAGKLETRSKQEVLIRELILVGLVAIAESQSPSAIQDRLAAFLSPKERHVDAANQAA
jgi:chemotaxis protein MotA